MIVDELVIRKDTVWKIVIEDLKKRVVFSCFVLHALTAEQEEDQVAACQGLVEIADSYPYYFKKNHNLIFCIQLSDEMSVICICWKKFTVATETLTP